MIDTDVCITMFNPSEKAVLCLQTLTENRGLGRIVILDNASSDKTYIEASAPYADLVVTMQHQVSLGALWNVGMDVARTPTVVLSNDDIVFTPDWLLPLQRAVLDDPSIGVVQPYNTLSKLPANFPDNYERIPGVGTIPRENFIGCCFMVNTSIYRKLKSFDWSLDLFADEYTYFYEKFYPFMYEDQDFYRRVRGAGFKTVTAFESYVHHWTGESMKKIPDYEEIKEASRVMFEKRWAGMP